MPGVGCQNELAPDFLNAYVSMQAENCIDTGFSAGVYAQTPAQTGQANQCDLVLMPETGFCTGGFGHT
jgi:hypothetical protein